MATTTFPADTAGVIWSPVQGWQDTEERTSGTGLVRNGWASGCSIDFLCTGTACTITVATIVTSDPVIQVSVDGGAFTNVTMPGSANTLTDLTLFTGLSDVEHTVSVRHKNGTHVRYFWVDITTALKVTGASPAINSALVSGFGPQYHFLLGGLNNCAFEGGWLSDGTSAAAITFPPPTYGYDAPALMKTFWSDTLIRFKTNATTIKIWCYRNTARIKLLIDGASSGSVVVLPATNDFGWVTLASGLDGASHEYGISYVTQNGSQLFYMYVVMTVGGTLDTATSWPRRGAIAFIGDSITNATSGTSNDSSLGFAFLLSTSKNRQCFNLGVDGTKLLPIYNSSGGCPRVTDAAQYMALQGIVVDYVVHNLGHNDANTATPPSSANYQTVWQNTLTQTRLAFPNATIYLMEFLPTTAASCITNRAALKTAAQAAVTALADAKILFIDTDTLWGTGGTGPGIGSAPTTTQVNNNTSDGVHPNATGHAALVSYISSLFTTWAPAAAGGSYTIVGSVMLRPA